MEENAYLARWRAGRRRAKGQVAEFVTSAPPQGEQARLQVWNVVAYLNIVCVTEPVEVWCLNEGDLAGIRMNHFLTFEHTTCFSKALMVELQVHAVFQTGPLSKSLHQRFAPYTTCLNSHLVLAGSPAMCVQHVQLWPRYSLHSVWLLNPHSWCLCPFVKNTMLGCGCDELGSWVHR